MKPGRIRTILCIGAHADDIEIGCGGTLLKLLALHAPVSVHWVVLSATPERKAEALKCAERFLEDADRSDVLVEEFTDSRFPGQTDRLKDYFAELGTRISPDIVFTHRLEDRHQDHRTVADLTWQTFRDHTILEYEIQKYEGDLTTPNLFVELDQSACSRKVTHIMDSYMSQRDKIWFDAEAFRSVMRIRGIEARSESGYAEGFHCKKLVL